jgi:diaminopimelate epimerase
MGPPVIEALQENLTVEGVNYKINKISMGNPHCVIFVDDPDKVDLASVGPIIENLPQFPNRTNVEFVRVKGTKEIAVKVWERGAGETLACGTGACAAVVAASSNDLIGRKALVHLPGGDLDIEWAEDNHVVMRGPAENAYKGTYVID